MPFAKVFIAVLAVLPVVFAGPFTLRTATTSKIRCATSLGPSSRALVGTSTKTSTLHLWPVFGTSVSTPIYTVTPPPVTTTSTVFATSTVTTTNTAITDVFSTTSTSTDTVTYSSIVFASTSTSTITSTGTTSTTVVTVIPTSPGFLPVESTTATAYPAKKRAVHLGAVSRGKRSSTPHRGGICASRYPQNVLCTDYVEILSTFLHIRTAATYTSTLPPNVVTVTTTAIATTTSTVVPQDVSTTLSFSTETTTTITAVATSTPLTTVSTTSTLTLTSTSSTYAACATNNILGPQGPNGLIEALEGTNQFVVIEGSSPYDCCVACIESDTCAGSFYAVGSLDVPACVLVQSNQCSSQSGFTRSYETNPVDDGYTYIVSNGNCGYLSYGGEFN